MSAQPPPSHTLGFCSLEEAPRRLGVGSVSSNVHHGHTVTFSLTPQRARFSFFFKHTYPSPLPPAACTEPQGLVSVGHTRSLCGKVRSHPRDCRFFPSVLLHSSPARDETEPSWLLQQTTNTIHLIQRSPLGTWQAKLSHYSSQKQKVRQRRGRVTAWSAFCHHATLSVKSGQHLGGPSPMAAKSEDRGANAEAER